MADRRNKYASYKEVRPISESETQSIHIIKDEAANRSYVRKRLHSDEQLDFYSRLIFLKHENLVRIYDVFREGSSIVIIEEYVRGQTLQAIMEGGGPARNKAAGYMAQICDILAYLHSQKPPIILGDIQPDKIMLSQNGTLKLLDFKTSGAHAAPESRSGGQADHRADVYAAGVLLREMISGGGEGKSAGSGDKLSKIADRCTQSDPGKRYQNVSALRKALGSGGFSFGKTAAVLAAALLVCAGGYFALTRFGGSIADAFGRFGGAAERRQAGPASGQEEGPGQGRMTVVIPGAETEDDGGLYHIFAKIASREEKPAILLDTEGVGDRIRRLTGDFYEETAGAFREYYPGYAELHRDPESGLYIMPACGIEDGEIRDLLLLEMDEDEMNMTCYSGDAESTFCFSTKADKGPLSQEAFQFIKAHPVMCENPVVFRRAPLDGESVAGVYHAGDVQKIEIFEDGGALKFSYANIIGDRDGEPLIVNSLHKIDEAHYWTENASSGDKGRLVLNFTDRYLIIFNELIADRTIIRLQGIYLKER